MLSQKKKIFFKSFWLAPVSGSDYSHGLGMGKQVLHLKYNLLNCWNY
jgi:hypothetical protein